MKKYVKKWASMKNFINIANINKQDLRKIIDRAKSEKKKDPTLVNQL